jgi:hypothetical protein
MRRLAPDLARRIDRMSWRAHLFHRFAHHPLCSEYASEVIRIGRRGRVCKGCALLALGLAAGAIAGIFVRVPTEAAVAVAVAAALLATASLWLRLGKVLSRLLPASLACLLTTSAILARSPAHLAVTATVWTATALLYLGYRRRGPDRKACAACPERGTPATCRGMAEIVRRERAFRRLSGRLIDAGDRDQSFAVQ